MRTRRNEIHRRHARAAVLLAALWIGLVLGGCGAGRIGGGYDDRNIPYEPDTPAPAPHTGVFVSDYGTMTFNGDGKTVQLDFDEALAGRLGLPAGAQNAVYAFRSGNLPPHGYIDIRYDAAMTFWLTVGEGDGAVSAMVDVGKFEDGHFYTGVNCVTADRITFFVGRAPGDSDWEPVDFLKA